ncbi:hypothetical protein BJ166DRAFT_500597 [Pestalotiopsis sp. NC0098]|nr:hypothetical protein BJ166DRAFT_500597 [Pestalotiopsis sp. NC0098]
MASSALQSISQFALDPACICKRTTPDNAEPVQFMFYGESALDSGSDKLRTGGAKRSAVSTTTHPGHPRIVVHAVVVQLNKFNVLGAGIYLVAVVRPYMGTMQMKLENGMPLAVGADLHATTDRSQSGSQYAGIVSEVVRAIPYRLALRRLLAAMAGFGWRQNRFDESAIRGHVDKRDVAQLSAWATCDGDLSLVQASGGSAG